MAGDTYGRLFTVTTFGESHGPGDGLRRRRLPAGSRAHGSRHPERSRSPPPGPLAARHAAAGARPGEDPVGRLRRPHDRHRDRPARGERRSAQRRLLEDQGQLSARSCRLHLSAEIRHSRLPRRRPRVRARNGDARGGRRDRAQVSRASSSASSIRGYLAEIGPFKLGAIDLEHVDDNPFFCADPAQAAAARSVHGRAARSRRLDRCAHQHHRVAACPSGSASPCSTSSKARSRTGS